jgi:hypothetical protein
MIAAILLFVGCNSSSDPTDREPDVDPTTPTDDTSTTTPNETGDTGAETPPLAPVCDAGSEAWVRRTMPLMWGRRPHGAAEIRYWAVAAETHGREAVVRAMARDPEYHAWWKEWFTDALEVARTGDKLHDKCFAEPKLPAHDGTLTAHLRGFAPDEARFPSNFNMADVILDGLAADDVSTMYQAHLFARMKKPVQGANVSAEELEYNRRIDFGAGFYRSYLSRDQTCLPCHNTEYSLTDHPDPALDRTWQLPGFVDRAVMTVPYGLPLDEAYSVFRTADVTRDRGGITPWGMDAACGRFARPDEIPDEDFLGQSTGTFIETLDATGSVWDLEAMFRDGRDATSGVGMTVGADQSVDGREAFTFLVATTIADQVWQVASGERLTVAHDFPRNEAQRDRLQSLVEPFLASDFSLVELLVTVATDPWLNAGVPASCEADPYGLPPVFDPWVIDDDDVAKRGNGPGDLAHRLHARALFRSAHTNLGWRPVEFWHEAFQTTEAETLQRATGVFLRDSAPGHSGTDFQGLLAWEATYGLCEAPGGRPAEARPDVIDQILERADAEGLLVVDVANAVSDRLLNEPVDPEARPLVEALLGRDFLERAIASDDFEAGVRRLCGALLLTPQAQLVIDPSPAGPTPRLTLGQGEDCVKVAGLMSDAGAPMTCDGVKLQ